MEHEGIFYFFEYADGAHTLVLVDAVGALKPAEGCETVPFHSEPQAARRDREYLNRGPPAAAFARERSPTPTMTSGSRPPT
jgi:type VI secretion system secreted protein VgrG